MAVFMKPKVSVCIPTYNGAAYLSECLESVMRQTFAAIEILIVDDGSSDNSVFIAQEYMRVDKRIRLSVNKNNLGLVGNWNHCVDLASGEWIKFVFQDDILTPECVTRMLDSTRPDVDLVAVHRSVIYQDGTPASVKEMYEKYLSDHNLTNVFPNCSYISPRKFTRILIQTPDGNCIGEPTATLIRKSAFAKYGRFNPNLISLCDWEYFARIAVNTGLCYIDEPLAFFRVHSHAHSAEIRNHRILCTIDSLIIQHEMAYFGPYLLVRSAAEKENPPIRLKYRLAEAVRRARWEASNMNDGGRAMAEWWRAIIAYPRLLLFPLTYVVNLGLQKFHH
jgi:glycosyltransferase involved in cell wall biosynthesis